MAVKTSWSSGDVLTAADLTDTFAAKAAKVTPLITGPLEIAGESTTMKIDSYGSGYAGVGPVSGYKSISVFPNGYTQRLGIAINPTTYVTDIFTWANGNIRHMYLSATGLITGDGDSLGAWQSFTPTVSGTGWALGNATAYGFQTRIGNRIHYKITITWGSTSTFGSGQLRVGGLSYAPGGTTANVTFGVGFVQDTSAAKAWSVIVQGNSGLLVPRTNISGGENNDIISTVPFTWASGDVLSLSGTYEAA